MSGIVPVKELCSREEQYIRFVHNQYVFGPSIYQTAMSVRTKYLEWQGNFHLTNNLHQVPGFVL